jgi:hypothetical protein
MTYDVGNPVPCLDLKLQIIKHEKDCDYDVGNLVPCLNLKPQIIKHTKDTITLTFNLSGDF